MKTTTAKTNIVNTNITTDKEIEKMNNNMMNNEIQVTEEAKRNGGFTTIEIIMLIAILVVLAVLFKDFIIGFAQNLFAQITAFDPSASLLN